MSGIDHSVRGSGLTPAIHAGDADALPPLRDGVPGLFVAIDELQGGHEVSEKESPRRVHARSVRQERSTVKKVPASIPFYATGTQRR